MAHRTSKDHSGALKEEDREWAGMQDNPRAQHSNPEYHFVSTLWHLALFGGEKVVHGQDAGRLADLQQQGGVAQHAPR